MPGLYREKALKRTLSQKGRNNIPGWLKFVSLSKSRGKHIRKIKWKKRRNERKRRSRAGLTERKHSFARPTSAFGNWFPRIFRDVYGSFVFTDLLSLYGAPGYRYIVMADLHKGIKPQKAQRERKSSLLLFATERRIRPSESWKIRLFKM